MDKQLELKIDKLITLLTQMEERLNDLEQQVENMEIDVNNLQDEFNDMKQKKMLGWE